MMELGPQILSLSGKGLRVDRSSSKSCTMGKFFTFFLELKGAACHAVEILSLRKAVEFQPITMLSENRNYRQEVPENGPRKKTMSDQQVVSFEIKLPICRITP